MVFQPGTFGKYVLLKRIAIGGMAEVFRAKVFGAEGFEKLAAVKRMLPHLSEDTQFVEMFIDEARLAANLNHANIVQIHDFGCIDDQYFISMEYVQGKDVADIVRELRERNLTTPLELACHIFIEVLNGLDYAQRLCDPYGAPLNLIHRDLSPHNILVSYEGEVKIGDFGIAKAASSTVHTDSGVLKGKYSYMSPEQARGMALDHKSDIFSLGVCFYEMLTLTKMFHADSDLSILEMVREARFLQPSEQNNAIPKELEAILLRTLEKKPDDRYSSAGEWRDEMERFLFANNLRFSSTWLAGFMREIFREDIEREQEELVKEVEIAKRFRAKARRAARIEKAAPGVLDMAVVKLPDKTSPLAKGERPAAAQGEDEFSQKNTLEERAMRPKPAEILVVVDDEASNSPSSLLSEGSAARPPGGGPDQTSPLGEREHLVDLVEHSGTEESASAPLVAGDFEKTQLRVSLPESFARSMTDTTNDVRRPATPKKFPFGVLISVLLVGAVGGGVVAFFFPGGDSKSARGDAGLEKSAAGAETPAVSGMEGRKTSLAVKTEELRKPGVPPVNQPGSTGTNREPPFILNGEVVPQVPSTEPDNKRQKPRKKKVATRGEKGFGLLDVGVLGSWAFVYINGAKVRTTPLLNYRLKAGKYTVELRDAEGRIVRRWRVQLHAKERKKLLHQ